MRLVSSFYKHFYPFDFLDQIDEFSASDNPSHLQKGDILVVWGGGDISPSLYNKAVSPFTNADETLSRRDSVEWNMMTAAVEKDIPIIGVCRGAQMLCALAGGFLIQHVDRHMGQHKVKTYSGDSFNTNSIHHQMMYPFDVKHEMLAKIEKPLSPVHYDVEISIPMDVEPEYVYFPTVKGHAIQWHPEAMAVSSEATQFIFKEIGCRL